MYASAFANNEKTMKMKKKSDNIGLYIVAMECVKWIL